jgi:hypothetical protein
MRISLARQKAFLVAYTPRSEFHGEDRQAAASIKLRVTVPNNVLDNFHETLRFALFFHDVENPKADLADKAMEGNRDHLPHRRFPNLGSPLKWNDAMEGGVLTIHHGVGGPSDIVISEIKVNKFSISAKEGGTCEIEFQVHCHPNEVNSGKLAHKVMQEIEITLEAPKAEEEEPQTSVPGTELVSA